MNSIQYFRILSSNNQRIFLDPWNLEWRSTLEIGHPYVCSIHIDILKMEIISNNNCFSQYILLLQLNSMMLVALVLHQSFVLFVCILNVQLALFDACAYLFIIVTANILAFDLCLLNWVSTRLFYLFIWEDKTTFTRIVRLIQSFGLNWVRHTDYLSGNALEAIFFPIT